MNNLSTNYSSTHSSCFCHILRQTKGKQRNFRPPFGKVRPCQIESPGEKHDYFEERNIATKVKRHEKPHYWLYRDLLQQTHFQYNFFQAMLLNEDTIPLVKVYSQFLSKIL